jgi:hypothetical protein
MKAFKDIAPCSLVEVDRRFREAYCLHRRDDAGGTDLWNVGLYIPEGYSLQKSIIYVMSSICPTDVSEKRTASIAVMMQAVRTSETSVYISQKATAFKTSIIYVMSSICQFVINRHATFRHAVLILVKFTYLMRRLTYEHFFPFFSHLTNDETPSLFDTSITLILSRVEFHVIHVPYYLYYSGPNSILGVY